MSDSSSLSSAPSSDDEKLKAPKTLTLKKGKLTAGRPPGRPRKNKVTASFSPERSPSPPAREASPPHEYVLADNPDIPVLVTFRARFHDAFPKHVPNFGPQDIEAGISSDEPSEQMDIFLCALLALVLNRKKIIERGHHGRALEEAIQTQKGQWPSEWAGANPLSGNQSFATMQPTERLVLLKTLVTWSLNTSEIVGGILRESYKQSRREDDVNQPLSVQPWGSDARKRRYWLIEGQNDTPFRLYIENQPKLIKRTWWSVAGTIDELKEVSGTLMQEGGQADRRLAERITASIPRLEQSEEKRKRRDYKKSRRAAFTRPEPGFSMYEGRTRGKRMRYTFSDDDDEGSDALSARRSTRQSNGSTPAEFNGPTVTASGRQVRSRFGRTYGDPIETATNTPSEVASGEASEASAHLRGGNNAPRRSNRAHATDQPRPGRHKGDYHAIDDLDDEDEAASTGNEWDGDDYDIEGKLDDDEDEDEDEEDDQSMASANESEDPLGDTNPQTLIIQLKYGKDSRKSTNHDSDSGQTREAALQSNGASLSHDKQSAATPIPAITSSAVSLPTQARTESKLYSLSQEVAEHPQPSVLPAKGTGIGPSTKYPSADTPTSVINTKMAGLNGEPKTSPSLPPQQYTNGMGYAPIS